MYGINRGIERCGLSYDISNTHLLHAGIPCLRGVCMRISCTMAILSGPLCFLLVIGISRIRSGKISASFLLGHYPGFFFNGLEEYLALF